MKRVEKKPTKFTLKYPKRFVVKMHQGVYIFFLLKWFAMLYPPIHSMEIHLEVCISHLTDKIYIFSSLHQWSNASNTLEKSDWHFLTFSMYWQKWTFEASVIVFFSSLFCVLSKHMQIVFQIDLRWLASTGSIQ